MLPVLIAAVVTVLRVGRTLKQQLCCGCLHCKLGNHFGCPSMNKAVQEAGPLCLTQSTLCCAAVYHHHHHHQITRSSHIYLSMLRHGKNVTDGTRDGSEYHSHVVLTAAFHSMPAEKRQQRVK
jgi:hypothetical protein